MKCRKCNSTNTRVTVTEHHNHETWRYHRCLDCTAKYKTIEKYVNYKPGPVPGRKQKKRYAMMGEGNHRSVLTDDNIRTIRLLAAKGKKQKDIAKEYGVSESRISAIVRRKAWSHVFP